MRMQRLQEVVDAVPDLGPSSRVMDVGCGTGCLIPLLQKRGVCDILAVDLAANMLAKACRVYMVVCCSTALCIAKGDNQ